MSDKVFFVNRSEIEGRLDPLSFHSERRETIAKLSNSRKIVRLINAVKSRKIVVKQSDKPYIGLENIQSHTGEYIESQEKEIFSSANTFQAGDILFSKLRPYLNKIHLAEFDGICSTEFHIFNGNQNYLNEFLAIYLRSNLIVNQTKYLMTGNTLPRLQTEDIYNLPIPVLSKDEQIEIVKKYNQAMLERKNKLTQSQTLLNSISDYLLEKLGITVPKVDNSLSSRIFFVNANDIRGGRLDPYFHNPQLKLSEFKCGFMSLGKAFTSCSGTIFSDENVNKRGVYNQNDIAILRANNIDLRTNSLDFSDVKYLNSDFPINPEHKLLKNDILVCGASGSKNHVGKVAFIREDLDYYFGGFMFVLRSKTNVFYPNLCLKY